MCSYSKWYNYDPYLKFLLCWDINISEVKANRHQMVRVSEDGRFIGTITQLRLIGFDISHVQVVEKKYQRS